MELTTRYGANLGDELAHAKQFGPPAPRPCRARRHLPKNGALLKLRARQPRLSFHDADELSALGCPYRTLFKPRAQTSCTTSAIPSSRLQISKGMPTTYLRSKSSGSRSLRRWQTSTCLKQRLPAPIAAGKPSASPARRCFRIVPTWGRTPVRALRALRRPCRLPRQDRRADGRAGRPSHAPGARQPPQILPRPRSGRTPRSRAATPSARSATGSTRSSVRPATASMSGSVSRWASHEFPTSANSRSRIAEKPRPSSKRPTTPKIRRIEQSRAKTRPARAQHAARDHSARLARAI